MKFGKEFMAVIEKTQPEYRDKVRPVRVPAAWAAAAGAARREGAPHSWVCVGH